MGFISRVSPHPLSIVNMHVYSLCPQSFRLCAATNACLIAGRSMIFLEIIWLKRASPRLHERNHSLIVANILQNHTKFLHHFMRTNICIFYSLSRHQGTKNMLDNMSAWS